MENKDMPAFPQSVAANEVGIWLATDTKPENNNQVTGLSKREMIAAMTMQGLMSCSDKGEFNSIEDSCAEAAHIAVKAADALLTELSKPKQ